MMTLRAGLLCPLLAASAVACGPPQAEVERTFSVVHTSPHHGAVQVSVGVSPVVAFSVPVSSAGLDEVKLQERSDEDFATLEATPFLGDDGLSVRLIPRRNLDGSTEHRLYVGPDLRAADGSSLGAVYTAGFFTGQDE